jgi:hypothetical protein
MPPAMHATLAPLYHLAMRLAQHAVWRAPAAAFLTALLLRLAWPRAKTLAAPLALLAGWLILLLPALTLSPVKPLDRLPGLALLLLAHAFLAPKTPKPAALPLLAALAAWWIAGAPLTGPAIAACVPVCLGSWAALALAQRLAPRDAGYATIGATLALSAAIFLAGGAPHWAAAALIPACVGAALLRRPDAIPPLALATMLTACLTVLASNRGRFLPVDVALLAPLLVWLLVPRIQPRLNKAAPAIAAAAATIAGAVVTVIVIKALTLR